MKKVLATLLCVMFIIPLFACGKTLDADGLGNSYEVYTGKEFCLPYIDGIKYECEDKSLIINGNFVIATEVKKYTVKAVSEKSEKIITITASDATPPSIVFENSFKYAPVGEVELFKTECFDEVDGFITPSVKVYDYENKEIEVNNNKFYTEKEGEYKIVYTANDRSGNTATENAVIFVSDDESKQNVLFPMESSWAQDKFFRHWNMKQEYSTEKKLPGEAGSTKISFTADLQPWAGCAFIKGSEKIFYGKRDEMITVKAYNDTEDCEWLKGNSFSFEDYSENQAVLLDVGEPHAGGYYSDSEEAIVKAVIKIKK